MAKSVNVEAPVMGRDLNEEIAKVAYEFYKKRGMTHGNDFEDWVKAEKIVRERYAKLRQEETEMLSEITRSASPKKRTKKAEAIR